MLHRMPCSHSPLTPSVPSISARQVLGGHTVATLEKPAEASGRQSADWRLQPWPEVQRRHLRAGRPQDVGNHRGQVGICHMTEARRPLCSSLHGSGSMDPEHKRKQHPLWGISGHP